MTLDDLGLVPTLRKFVGEFGERNAVNAHLRVVGEEIRMGGGLEQTLFRIVQEALNNARKHAKATNVEVVITFLPTQVSAVIRDDGVGMDVDATEARVDRTRHFGLLTMRERADGDKGKLEIRSRRSAREPRSGRPSTFESHEVRDRRARGPSSVRARDNGGDASSRARLRLRRNARD